jgi:uncharacterized small protein (DUF1192 family)
MTAAGSICESTRAKRPAKRVTAKRRAAARDNLAAAIRHVLTLQAEIATLEAEINRLEAERASKRAATDTNINKAKNRIVRTERIPNLNYAASTGLLSLTRSPVT